MVRHEAAEALGAIGTEEAVALLQEYAVKQTAVSMNRPPMFGSEEKIEAKAKEPLIAPAR